MKNKIQYILGITILSLLVYIGCTDSPKLHEYVPPPVDSVVYVRLDSLSQVVDSIKELAHPQTIRCH